MKWLMSLMRLLADVPAAAWAIIGAIAGGTVGAVLGWLLPFLGRRIGKVKIHERICKYDVDTCRTEENGTVVKGVPFAQAEEAHFLGDIILENQKDLPVAVYGPQLRLLSKSGKALFSIALMLFGRNDILPPAQMIRLLPHWPERAGWSVSLSHKEMQKARGAITAELEISVAGTGKPLSMRLGPIQEHIIGFDPRGPASTM